MCLLTLTLDDLPVTAGLEHLVRFFLFILVLFLYYLFLYYIIYIYFGEMPGRGLWRGTHIVYAVYRKRMISFGAKKKK